MKNEELKWLISQQEQDRLDELRISGGIDLELKNRNNGLRKKN